jgi:hypothetical protein
MRCSIAAARPLRRRRTARCGRPGRSGANPAGTRGRLASPPPAATATPSATSCQPNSAEASSVRSSRAWRQASGVFAVNNSQQVSLSAISRTAPGPSWKDSCERRSLRTAGASTSVTSASPEWSADSGIDPQHAASARTMPNASGKVLGMTSACDADINSDTSSCSIRPAKCRRCIAAGAAAR